MRLANLNVKASPVQMSRARVRSDLERVKAGKPAIVTWQELGKRLRYRRVLRQVFLEHRGWRHYGLSRRTAVSVDTDIYDVLRIRSHRLSKWSPLAGQPARWAVEVVVRGQVFDQYPVAVLSVHLTNGGYNGRNRGARVRRLRKALWDEQFAELRRIVAELHAEGLDVIVAGDFNRVDLPRLHVGQRDVLSHRIDHMLVVPSAGNRFEALARVKVMESELNTDHPLLAATLRRQL